MTSKTNQFRSLIAASGQSPAIQPSLNGAAAEQPIARKRIAKRTAPDYVQVGIYLPKQLHNQAKVLLIHEGHDRDFSQLIGDLLSAFVNDRSKTGS